MHGAWLGAVMRRPPLPSPVRPYDAIVDKQFARGGQPMTTKRVCAAATADGKRCPVAPLRDGEYCFMHSPDHSAEAAEARRLGGLRRRRALLG